MAPELSGYPITVPEPVAAAQVDPLWWSSSAVLGGRFVAKFAWSRPAAIRLAREIGTLTALTREPKVPFLPEVVAGRQLARFLAALHQPTARKRAEAAIGKLC